MIIRTEETGPNYRGQNHLVPSYLWVFILYIKDILHVLYITLINNMGDNKICISMEILRFVDELSENEKSGGSHRDYWFLWSLDFSSTDNFSIRWTLRWWTVLDPYSLRWNNSPTLYLSFFYWFLTSHYCSSSLFLC